MPSGTQKPWPLFASVCSRTPIAGMVAELLASAAATSVEPDAPTEPVA